MILFYKNLSPSLITYFHSCQIIIIKIIHSTCSFVSIIFWSFIFWSFIFWGLIFWSFIILLLINFRHKNFFFISAWSINSISKWFFNINCWCIFFFCVYCWCKLTRCIFSCSEVWWHINSCSKRRLYIFWWYNAWRCIFWRRITLLRFLITTWGITLIISRKYSR